MKKNLKVLGIHWGGHDTSASITVNGKLLAAAEQERYDNVTYDVKRRREYPTIAELVVALYDTDDKADIDRRRAEVKARYPKP